MLDLRLYRVAFAPALLALVTLMFSLQGVPPPLEPAVPPGAFEPSRAAATAREIAAAAPERPPGSAGDAAAAELVTERFTDIRAGTTTEQELSTSYDGDRVTVRNVLIVLPGDSAETIVVLAGRDSARGPGAASSAAATGVLLELAAALGASSHTKTLVFASTSGDAAGAAGARALVDALPDPASIAAVVVLSQPGASEPEPPHVIATSSGPSRPAAQLTATAGLAVETQTGREDPSPSAAEELARLALPTGIGAQAPLIDAGLDAVAISAAGERPLEPGEDTVEALSVPVLGDFGRAAAATVQAVDAAEAPLETGPEPYVEVGGNLVPGWTLGLLALALLLPAVLAAADASARVMRRSRGLGRGLAATAALAAPLLAALLALYLFALLGLVPRPAAPFDPGRFGIGAAAGASLFLLALVLGAATLWARSRAPRGVPPDAHLAAGGILACAAVLLGWLANPYLGLLLVPLAHVWLVPAAGGRLAATLLAAAAAVVPLAYALWAVASSLELGAAAPWTFLVMVASGEIGFWTALALCLALSGLIAAPLAARRGPPPGQALGSSPQAGVRARPV